MHTMRQQGFTLIEILVVVFLIAIISGISALSLSGADAQRLLHEEAKRLQIMMGLAAQEAVMLGSPIGIVFQADSYAFVIVGSQDWEQMKQHTQLKKHLVKPMFKLKVIEAATASLSLNKDPKLQPQVIFFSTGLISRFKIEINFHDGHELVTYQLSLLKTGDVGIELLTR